MRRDPARAILVLDAMLQFFDGGRRWTRGKFNNQAGQRCLTDALRHVQREQRIPGAGTENYLRDAMFSTMIEPPDQLSSLARLLWRGTRDLITYNDASDGYDDVRALIIKARAIAQAELGNQNDHSNPDHFASPEQKAELNDHTQGNPGACGLSIPVIE